MTDKSHQVSQETIYHFSCHNCNKWWSIGDWDKTDKIICPHCGDLGIVEMVEVPSSILRGEKNASE
jgi:rRNA maturation endonuclease Nob1